MRDLIVIPKAAALSLDAAAAFLRSSFPEADWLAIDVGDPSGETDGPGGPGHESALPDGLAWLFGGAVAAPRAPSERLGEAIKALEGHGVIYACGCAATRLQELAAADLTAGREPRYDGCCRKEPASPPDVARWRLRSGDPDDRDRPVDDVFGVAALLGEGSWSRLVVPWDLAGAGRRAIHLARALGAEGIGLEVGPMVVGPDGAPLWRTGALATVTDLAERGYEPRGVRRFLGTAGEGPSVFFSLEGLADANRAGIREEPESTRLARLAAELRSAGIACPEDPDGRRRYWDATAERVDRYRDVARHLAFLGSGWSSVDTPERDQAQLRRAATAVLEGRPEEGQAVRGVLEEISRREDEIHDLRRVVRWAITGQSVAPPLTTVWDLLGAERALERLSKALARIG